MIFTNSNNNSKSSLTSTHANPHLCSNLQRPDWCHENSYIISGYRRPGGQTKAVLCRTTLGDSQTNTIRPPEETSEKRRIRTISNASVFSAHQDDELQEQEMGGLLLELQKENPVLPGEDSEVNTYRKCLESLGYWSNESINIHTHLWGSIISMIILALHVLAHFSLLPKVLLPFTHHAIFYPPAFKTDSKLSQIFTLTSNLAARTGTSIQEQISNRGNDWKDILSFGSFLLAAAACFGCSAAFHTCQCLSKEVARRFQKLDYLGIVLLASGSYIPALNYGFFCHPWHFSLYILSVSFLAIGAIWVTFDPLWATPAYRPYRTSVFIVLGLSAVIPSTHAASIYGWHTIEYTMGFKWLGSSGAIYILGALIYIAQTPERFVKGKFDYIGSSHQIFHSLILVGAFCQYLAIRRSYHFWHAVEVLNEIQAISSPSWVGKQMICKVLESSS